MVRETFLFLFLAQLVLVLHALLLVIQVQHSQNLLIFSAFNSLLHARCEAARSRLHSQYHPACNGLQRISRHIQILGQRAALQAVNDFKGVCAGSRAESRVLQQHQHGQQTRRGTLQSSQTKSTSAGLKQLPHDMSTTQHVGLPMTDSIHVLIHGDSCIRRCFKHNLQTASMSNPRIEAHAHLRR